MAHGLKLDMQHVLTMLWGLYRSHIAISIMLVSILIPFYIYIITKTYTLGVRKTYDRIQELYYGITESQVNWVIQRCGVCTLQAANKGRPSIKPIKVKCCLDQLVIDLMDFRATADGDWKWILQKKDPLSRYIWLDPLKEKGAAGVCENLVKWFGENGHPRKLYVTSQFLPI